jgi:hypothetical protein
MVPTTSYDPETVGLLMRVFNEAWADILAIIVAPPLDPNAMSSALAKRLLAAANEGERDPARLKLIAMGAIDA